MCGGVAMMNLEIHHKLEVRNKSLFVDGLPFVVDEPREELSHIEDGKLVTLFRGHLTNYWEPQDIKGYYA